MNKVTLYQVSKKDVMVTGDHLEISRYDKFTPIRDSDEFILHQEVKSVRIPVQKYIFNQQNWKTKEVNTNVVYAAFDDELLELIQCERSKFKQLNDDNFILFEARKVFQENISELNSKVLKLEDTILRLNMSLAYIKQAGFWKRLVYLFKGF